MRIAKIYSLLNKFPVPFLKAYPPLWIIACLVLIFLDLGTKKIATEYLNFNLHSGQIKYLSDSNDSHLEQALEIHPQSDAQSQANIWGENGKYTKLRLVFNDKFVFSLGPSYPYIGAIVSFLAICFLLFYRWYNYVFGHPIAWLLVFSGALGNMIDKLFIKSLITREWSFSLGPQKGHVSGVVDFIECIWFGWTSLSDTFILSIFSMRTWPTFNVADSMISIGVIFLIISLRKLK